ncbi:MAG: hypothetical protein COU07_01815 [Candidatus Harrisonbacteria bacterium CG10_big_fil_rev_8_21_14_0_10_40_38]|uniref:histidine kinase n=1 Tax=Candidatus Harrisonbacteria bacterium CG10_big_fil_rev_8_21_14_0_10_40_38 TaxID=1974583 RepID=A0A2H0UT68_9BACT|nr:MAG: hypothetical protein COU07_01815 [Candidatus Harrisonbacteria bacterium CG10_big_fil_rev_8_21_14_0_10_40_38]
MKGFWETTRGFFGVGNNNNRQFFASDREADKIIQFLISLVPEANKIQDALNAYSRAQQLTGPDRSLSFVTAYFSLENFIVNRRPPDVSRVYTRSELRSAVRDVADINILDDALRLVFLSESEQAAVFLFFGVEKIFNFLSSRFGEAHVKNLVSSPVSRTFLSNAISPQIHKLDIKRIANAAVPVERDVVIAVFKELYKLLYEDMFRLVGSEVSQKVVDELFRSIQRSYDYDLTSLFVRVLPDGVLDNERLTFLSREELTRKIREATKSETEKRELAERLAKELSEAKEKIEEKVRERTVELEREKIKLDYIAQNMDMGALLFDGDGKLLFANHAARRFLEVGDAHDEKVVEALSSKFSSCTPQKCIESCNAKKPLSAVEVDTGRRIFLFSSTCLFSGTSNQEFFGALIWIYDITDTKLLERSKNEFIAIASHEMRTPLAIIRGYAETVGEMMATKLSKVELKKMMDGILTNTVRLLGIVNNFLDLTRLENKKIEVNLEKFDVVEIVSQVENDFREQAKEKNIQLIVKIPKQKLPFINADKAMLQEVLVNLVGNAFNYTNAGSVTVDVSIEGGSIAIRVIDTGIGISPKQQLTLFQKFQSLGRFSERREYGSGLGLYITRLLIEMMGGSISLESSEQNKGSVFKVFVPIAT